MKAKILITLFLFFSTFSCNQQKKTDKTDRYDNVAAEFISQIFDNKIYECSYIVKPSSEFNLLERLENEMPDIDFRDRLMRILKIKKKATLDTLIGFSKDFKFKKSMFQKSTGLIENTQLKAIKAEFDSLVKYGTQKEIKESFKKCPNKFYFISKPIFDIEYKTAIIDIQIGITHLKRPLITFKLVNGSWKKLNKNF